MQFNVDPWVDGVKFKFTCPCGEKNEIGECVFPSPNWEAENYGDSVESDFFVHECPNCQKNFNVTLYSGFGDCSGEIDSDEVDDLEIEEVYSKAYLKDIEDASYREWFYHTHSIIDKTLFELESASLSEEVLDSIYKSLYANVCAKMELSLKDCLKRYVLSTHETKRKFVENYAGYKAENFRFRLTDIFKRLDSLDKVISDTLDDIIYHDLKKIKPMYKEIVGIDLGEIPELFKAVLTRHDIVHRDGKTKDGKDIKVTKEDVKKFADQVRDLMYKLDTEVSSKIEGSYTPEFD